MHAAIDGLDDADDLAEAANLLGIKVDIVCPVQDLYRLVEDTPK